VSARDYWNQASLRARTYRVRRLVVVAPIGASRPIWGPRHNETTCMHGHFVCTRCQQEYLPTGLIQRRRRVNPDAVQFALTVEQDDVAVRGNVCDCPRSPCDCERAIEERLEHGDVWAWCWVKVSARYTDELYGELEVDDALGGCSYENEKDFRACHWQSMTEALIEELETLINP